MSLGRGVHAIDGAGCDVNGGVETESEIGAGQVVIDRLGHAYDFDALLV